MAAKRKWATMPMTILALTLMVGPFLQEPYFASNVFLVITAIGVAALIWLAGRFSGRKPLGVQISLPAIGLGLLTATYAAQLIWAVYPRGALDSVLRVAAALIVLVLVQAAASPELRRQVAWVVLASGAMVAVHGLLQFFGAVPNTLQHTLNTAGRIPGLYNYANSTAIALGVGLLAGLGLALQGKVGSRQWVIVGASGLISVTLFLTLSRGVLYGLPLAILLALAGINRRLWPAALRFLAIGFVVPLLIGWGLASWGGPAPDKVSRLIDARPQTQNLIARVQFLKDALAASADQPWGYGGNSWSRVYRQYQPVNYVSSNPHNHYALTLVEAGVPGLLALLFALLSALWLGFRHRSAEEPLRWVLVVAGATLAGHSMIDMNLSRLGLWLLLWVLLGAAQPSDAGLVTIQRKWWLPASLAAIVLLTSSWLVIGEDAFRRAVLAIQINDQNAAAHHFQRAITTDPWNSATLLLLRNESNLRRAAKVDPQNPQIWQSAAELSKRTGDLDKAHTDARQALDLQPALPEHYALLAQVLSEKVDAALIANNTQEVRGLASEMVELGDRLSTQIARVQSTPGQWSKPQVSWTESLHLQMGKGLFLSGKSAEAEEHLKLALKAKNEFSSSASTWLHALYQRQGRAEDLKALAPTPNSNTLRSDLYQAIATWQN